MWWIIPLLLGGGMVWAVTAIKKPATEEKPKESQPEPKPTPPPQFTKSEEKPETPKRESDKVNINELPSIIKVLQSQLAQMQAFVANPAFIKLPELLKSSTTTKIEAIKSMLAKAEEKLKALQTPPPTTETPTEKIQPTQPASQATQTQTTQEQEQEPTQQPNLPTPSPRQGFLEKIFQPSMSQTITRPSVTKEVIEEVPVEQNPMLSPSEQKQQLEQTQKQEEIVQDKKYEEPTKEEVLPPPSVPSDSYEFNIHKSPLKDQLLTFGNQFISAQIINGKAGAKNRIVTTLSNQNPSSVLDIPKADIPEKFEVRIKSYGGEYPFSIESSKFVNPATLSGYYTTGLVSPPKLSSKHKTKRKPKVTKAKVQPKLSPIITQPIPGTTPRFTTYTNPPI